MLDASISSAGEESHTSSELEEASEAPNAQSTMQHVLAMIESGNEADRSKFDPDADEEEHYNKCDHTFDNEIIGAVLAEVEPFYEYDDYDFIDHNDEQFEDIYNMWCDRGPMAHEKAELEFKFFTGSDFPRNVCGYNPNPEKVHADVSREKKR